MNTFYLFESYEKARRHIEGLIRPLLAKLQIPDKNIFLDTYPTTTPAVMIFDRFEKSNAPHLNYDVALLNIHILLVDSYKKNKNVKETAIKRIKEITHAIDCSAKYHSSIDYEEYLDFSDVFAEQTIDQFKAIINCKAYFKL